MQYLIVNGDDFGASRGINRGVLEAHTRGILTSASLMVDTLASEEAAALARPLPALSLGLHADLDNALQSGGLETWRSELHRQLERFCRLVGRPPTHLDSHHNVHRDARLLPVFRELAQCLDIPLRDDSPIRSLSGFYGQWGGETHPEHIGVQALIRLLTQEIQPGVSELCCHPGYVEADLRSSYRLEREIELQTLCDPAVRQTIAVHCIRLISFRDAGAGPASAS